MQSLKWNLPINGRRNFSEGTTDDRASFQKTRPPILGSCGKPVSFSLAADFMSPVSHWIIFYMAIQPGFSQL